MEKRFENHYRQLRVHGFPATEALAPTRNQQALEERISKLGIEWRDQNGLETARWSQDGFDIVVVLKTDPDGWWTFGESDYGRFSNEWQPGAIRHDGGPGAMRWFIPVMSELGRESYRKARSYGRHWWYVTMEVKTFRHGVLLAEKSLAGLEYDLDRPTSERELEFSGIAFKQAGQVVLSARAKLRELCADVPCAS